MINLAEKDIFREIQLYKIEGEKGNHLAQYILGTIYEKTDKKQEAIKCYLSAASNDNVFAQYKLSRMYFKGEGINQNYIEALRWCNNSAIKGYAPAENFLGIMYKNGYGVEENLVEAVKWYKKSAEQGYVYSQYNLGVVYELGEGIEKDYQLAANWYIKAAEQGYDKAENSLGDLYLKGNGVPRDYK